MSAILSVDDLNDFIAPGVACIKPIETLPAAPEPTTDSSLEHEVILDGTLPPSSATTGAAPDPSQPAQISLTDCLACSGCVTSAEAVLVSLQSHSEVLSVLDSAPGLKFPPLDSPTNNTGSKLFVASVAPQVIASLASVLSISPAEAWKQLHHFLTEELGKGGRHGNAFTWMVSTDPANDMVRHLSADEVLGAGTTSTTSAAPIATTTAKARVPITNNGQEKETQKSRETKPKTPILASACPGWVCYAEKTHPHVLPHLSRIKSPQAITGTLLKSVLSRKLDISPDRIWHLAVMPCFDKKLEAAREELTADSWGESTSTTYGKGIRDVDCVITSKEIFLLAQESGLEFGKLDLSTSTSSLASSSGVPFPDPLLTTFFFPPTTPSHTHAGVEGSSGGILNHILLRAAHSHPSPTRATAKRLRNVDVVEYEVRDTETDAVVLKAARYYGFRNIQNLVRKLKPARVSRLPGAATSSTSRAARVAGGRKVPAKAKGVTADSSSAPTGGMDYAYVEVMACPGGCTNGGGQVKVDDGVVVERMGKVFGERTGVEEQKAWLGLVDEAYYSGGESSCCGGENEPRLDNSSCDGGCGERGGGCQDSGTRGLPGRDKVTTIAVVGGKCEEKEKHSTRVGGLDPLYIANVLQHWSSIVGVTVEKLVTTGFREVVSDVGKDVSETERIIQMASKVGGGW